jgi:hypothetical protein
LNTRLSPGAADDERDLLARAARWPAYPSWTDLTEEALRRTARQEGIDFATALAYDRLVRSPAHRELAARLVEGAGGRPAPRAPDLTVGIVPGAFYREDHTSGANGRFVLESLADLGCRAEVLPLPSFGPLPGGAQVIRDWLRGRPGGPVVLVSLSKGSAEVKLALAAADAAEVFRDVRAWVSLSGLYSGTPLVSWLLRRRWRMMLIRFLFRLRGYDLRGLCGLERGPGGPLDFEVRPPPHLRVIHVAGFPLARHLSCPRAARGHRRLGSLGPNDGAILLADLLSLPGWIYPVWGADHFLRPAWDRGLVARLLRYVSELPDPEPTTLTAI